MSIRVRVAPRGFTAPFAALACGALALAATPSAVAKVPLPPAAGGAYQVSVTSWRDMPFRTVVRQQYDYSCGSAALATLLHFSYGRPVGEAEIFKEMYAAGDQEKIRRVGFSLLEMKQYLAKHGLQADGYRMTLAEIERLQQPGIVLVTTGAYRHFVVVKGVANGRVLVGDPALGQRTFAAAEFMKMWTNGIFFAVREGDGRFNARDEWLRQIGPMKDPYLAEHSGATLLRELPTIYQITPVFHVPGG